MRVSNLAAGLASAAVLLSSAFHVLAASSIEAKVHDHADKPQLAAAHNVEHQARSPQDPNELVSYDYGYSLPAPPSPTTYGDESSSSSTTAYGSTTTDDSYTGVSSVASVTGTSSNSSSPTVTSTDAESGTLATVSEEPTLSSSPGTSWNSTTASLSLTASSANSSATSTRPPLTSSVSNTSPSLSQSTVNNSTAASSPITTGTASATLAPPFTASNSSVTTSSGTVSTSDSVLSSLTKPIETPWPTWNSSAFIPSTSSPPNITSVSDIPIPPVWTSGTTSRGSNLTTTQLTSSNQTSATTSATLTPPITTETIGNTTTILPTISRTLSATSGWNSTVSPGSTDRSQTTLGTGWSSTDPAGSQTSAALSSSPGSATPTETPIPIPFPLPNSTITVSTDGTVFVSTRLGSTSTIPTGTGITSAPPFPVNSSSTVWPSGTVGWITEETSSQPDLPTNSSAVIAPFPTGNRTSVILSTGVSSSLGTGTPISLSSTGLTAPWNSTTFAQTDGPTGLSTGASVTSAAWNSTIAPSSTPFGTGSVPSQFPNSTTASVNATWTGGSSTGDTVSSTATASRPTSIIMPPWSASNSTTSAWATGTVSIPMSSGVSGSGSLAVTSASPPWPTLNSTTPSLTGTVSIPVITSSSIVGTGFSGSATNSGSQVFTWTNSTSVGASTGSLTGTGMGTITGAPTASTLWPTGTLANVTWTSQPNTSVQSNGTVFQTPTANSTQGTATGTTFSTPVPPFPTGNSTLAPFPTGVNTSSIWLSTVMSTIRSGTGASSISTVAISTLTAQRPFPSTNLTSTFRPGNATSQPSSIAAIPTMTGGSSTNLTTLPPFPTANSTSLPVITGNTTLPISGTGSPGPSTHPPFPTGNSTVAPGPTGTGPMTSASESGTLFQTSTGLNATATPPPFPAGNVTVIPVSTGNLTVTWLSSVPSGVAVSTMTITRAQGRRTQTLTVLPSSSTTPPFPTWNSTVSLTATGISPGTAVTSPPSSQWPNSTSSASANSTLPSSINGSATLSLNITASSVLSGTPSTQSVLNNTTLGSSAASSTTNSVSGTAVPAPGLPTSSAPFGNSTAPLTAPTSSSPMYPPTGSGSAHATITNSTGPAETSTPCHTITVTNGTITRVITRSVLVSSLPTSADPPLTSNCTDMPPKPTYTSKWQNTTSTFSSIATANRTSSTGLATTLITSTTSGTSSSDGDTTLFGPVVPTTTLSGAPLPSNAAYPWGGVGPIFRHHNITAEGDDDGSVDQPVVAAEGMGAWWARWKRHFDRLKTGGEGADGSHDT